MAESIHILYVDDEPDLLDIGKLFLEESGEFTVTTTLSAAEGIRLLEQEKFDAIISDYQMPGMDGIQFLIEVRKRFGPIPFILFTGRGREEIVIQAINSGADFYLQKGGEPGAQFAELTHKIRQAVQHRQADVRIWDHERREADIINFLPDATFAIDTNGVVIAWNHAMEEMCGIKAAEILGKGNYEYSIPLYNERRPILVDLILHNEPSIAAKYPSLKRDGQTLIAEATSPDLYNGRGATIWFIAAPLYNNRGEVVGAIESIRDITGRKQQELALLKNAEELHASYEEITATEEELRANLDQMTRQELELRESKRELTDIIEFLPDATFVIDRQGVVIAWNHAIEEMTGIRKVDMIGQGDQAYTIPFYGDRRKHLLDLIDLEEKELQAKYQHVTRKGHTLYAETFTPALFGGKGAYVWVTGSPLFDLQGNRIGAIESVRDISGRRKAEEALKESRRQLDSMATNIPGVVFRYYVNPDGTTGFDYISGRSQEILGLENDKATFEERFTQGVVPENRDRLISSIQHAVTTKTLWVFDSQYVKPSDEKIWVSAVSSPIMENDRLIFDGAFFDITERKRAEVELLKKNEELNASYEQIAAAEEELRGNVDELTRQEKALIAAEQETRVSRDIMRAYLDHSYDAVFIHDNAGKVLDVNATTLRLYRVTREEALRYTIADYTGPAYAMDKAREHWERVLAGEDRFFPWQARRPNDGSVFDVEVYLTPITIDGRQIILTNIRDITERKRAEEEIVKKNEELHAANEQLAAAEEELKGQFDALAKSEQMIRESEERVRNKLESLLSPEGDIGNLDLADIIDVQEIQSMMDDFHALTHIGIAILDINGKILVATGWQDICTKFHRVNPETCANCAESDTFLASGVEPGTVKRYRCKNNMWDLVTPISIGGSHVGNLFLGQFLYEDESVNDELFHSQAMRYGFDEQPYLAALERVPRWNRETVDTVMAFYAKFALMVSTLSHSNITLARTVTERDKTLNSLLKVNQKLNVLSQLTRQDLTTQIFVLNSYLEMAKKQAKGQDGIIRNLVSGERTVRLIKEITEFTKDYQNMGEKPPKWQNVKLAILFGLSHISIGEIRHSLETENLEIFADPLLEKAFQGLLENSVKHGGHVSEIRVSYTVTPDWATIIFEDNGVGIPQEKKERIFLRGEGARASVRGLFFVQEILSITGIIIRETGEPGKGARFEMTVPKGAWRMKGDGA